MGLLFQPHWQDLCTAVKQNALVPDPNQRIIIGPECEYVGPMAMAGNFLIGFGVFTMIIMPIVFSLIQVRRDGYNWETSRVETAVTNLPILSGFLYIVAGFGVALLAAS